MRAYVVGTEFEELYAVYAASWKDAVRQVLTSSVSTATRASAEEAGPYAKELYEDEFQTARLTREPVEIIEG